MSMRKHIAFASMCMGVEFYSKDVVKAYETEATKKTIAKAYPDKSTIPAWGLKLK